MILEIVEDFDITTFEGLVDNFRIEAVGCHPDPETLIEFLTEWGNSINQKVNKIFSFNFYARLLRWCITEGWHINSGIIDAARELWKYLFGSLVPTFYQYNRFERKYEIHVSQWREWYEKIKMPVSDVSAT